MVFTLAGSRALCQIKNSGTVTNQASFDRMDASTPDNAAPAHRMVEIMRYEIIGCTLVFTSAFLYTARFITAVLFIGPGLKNWNKGLFEAGYSYIGNGLTIWSIVALLTGIVVLLLAFQSDRRKDRK
mgnify:CR=1|jgi:hypothetical protein